MKKIGVLASGGVESTCLLAHYLRKGYRVYPLYVRTDLIWEKAEISHLNRILENRILERPDCLHPLRGHLNPLTVLPLSLKSYYRRHWSLTGKGIPSARSRDEAVYLPGRNLILLSAACLFAAQNGISEIALGILRTNPFPDATPSFLKSMRKTIRAALGKTIFIRLPFARCDKEAVLRRFRFLPLERTFSCLNPQKTKPCGECNKCEEHRRAVKTLRFLRRDRRDYPISI